MNHEDMHILAIAFIFGALLVICLELADITVALKTIAGLP